MLPPTQDPTILLVDDEPLVREVAQRSLQLKGYPVITASSGSEGVERFQQERQSIGIVVADIKMPGLTGPQMIEQIRAIAPKSHRAEG
jgi:two-component system, cell cycle sensor histidine kinase and response regulator CckA